MLAVVVRGACGFSRELNSLSWAFASWKASPVSRSLRRRSLFILVALGDTPWIGPSWLCLYLEIDVGVTAGSAVVIMLDEV